jgi:transcription termination/antitermination protein NusG
MSALQDGASIPAKAGCDSAEQWFALHTRAKHEKKVAFELQRRGVSAFVPFVAQVRQWSDRKKVLESALFSCYAFVHTHSASEIYRSVLQTPGVLRWVTFGTSPAAIPTAQIEAVKRIVEARVNCTVHPLLKAGQKVRIRGGCLEGLECVLLSQPGDRKLVVSLERIQRSICISADGYILEPI